VNLLFFSDPHLANWDDFSQLLPNGDNSRLTDLLDLIGRLPELAKKHRADMVVCGGDLFHHPRNINTQVYQKAYAALEAVAANVEQLILLCGNHDQALFQRQSATALYPLKHLPNTKIILQPDEISYPDGTVLSLLPYLESRDETKRYLRQARPGSVLVSHCGLSEATIGPNEIQIDGALSLADLEPLEFEAAFFGHYHKAQNLTDNVFVLGALSQHNMADRGEKRGVLLYDTAAHEAKRIWLNGPKFFLFEVANDDDLKRLKSQLAELRGGYVRVLLRTKQINREAVSALLEQAAVRSHQVRYAIATEASPRNEALTTKLLGCGLEDALPAYVEHASVDGLDKLRLVELGKALLKEHELATP
jgi:DNA repair exonuclease SbcCD nuclease subunit